MNTIHGTIWYDENGNGLQDGLELVYPGASLQLFEDADSNAIPDGGVFASTVSDALGEYQFDTTLNHTQYLTYDQRIQASGNDAYEIKVGSAYDVMETDIIVEFGFNGAKNYGAGFRYTDLNIPPNAIIDSAFMYIDNANATGLYTTSVDIFAENAATTNAFSDVNRIWTRPTTTAFVRYDTNWSGGETDDKTPDISAVIQELVDTYGAIDDVALIWHNNAISTNQTPEAVSYDTMPARAARLVVYYTVPGTEPFHFLVGVDMASLPPTAVLTTSTFQPAAFYLPDTEDCTNDFGFGMTVPNTAPAAVDDTDTTTNVSAISIDVLSNDSDPQATDDLIITSIAAVPDQGGTAVINDNGTPGDPDDDFIDFTPSGSYFGYESFDYEICDNSFPVLCDTATVTVWIACVNDSVTINTNICQGDSFLVGSTWYSVAGTHVTIIPKAYCDSVVTLNLTIDPTPSAAIAGPDQTLCNTSSFTMAATAPASGIGTWSVVSGSASITTPSSPATTVTGVAAGASVTLQWTVSSGLCAVNTDEVTITNDELPVSNAGPDQTLCNTSSFTMAASNPALGTGAWSLISGSATIATPSSNTTTVTGLTAGSNATLRWTVTNGTCVATDDITISNDELPTVSSAGPDQTLCNTSSFTMAANTPAVGTGAWSIVSGSATITAPASPTTTVTGVSAGSSVTLRWTISNGVCTASTDDVTIANNIQTTANAGPDQTLCNTSTFTMAANTPAAGSGAWSIVSGTATITTPSSPTTAITGVAAGTSVTLRWTTGNGVCPDANDDVTIRNDELPSTAAAGPDQALCNTSGFTMAANAPVVGTGAWSIVSGSATITAPSSPTTTVTGVAAGASVTLRWTISNGVCTVSTDDITIQNDEFPTASNAGPDQVLCNTSSFTMAANAPALGTGVWSIVSGSATITTPSSPTTTVTAVAAGTSVTLRWTISNGVCLNSIDDVTIQNDELPTVSNAGPDQTLCNTSGFTMAANTPAA
jgi:hypothetical protein